MDDNNGKWTLAVNILSVVIMVVGSGVGGYFAFTNAANAAIFTFLITMSFETVLLKHDSHRMSKGISHLGELTRCLSSKIDSKDGRLVIRAFLQSKTDVGIPSIPTQAENAREIWALFVTGRDFVDNYGAFLQKRCRDKCKLRVLCAEEKGQALEVWGSQTKADKSPGDTERDVNKEARRAKEWFDKFPTDRIDVRYLDGFIPFTMFATNPNGSDGEIVVGFQVYAGFTGQRPYVHIRASDNSPWYEFFKAQYESMFGQARRVTRGKDR